MSLEEKNHKDPETQTHRKRGGPREDRGRDWSDAATSQGTPDATRHWEIQESIFHSDLSRESGPANTWTLYFWSLDL